MSSQFNRRNLLKQLGTTAGLGTAAYFLPTLRNAHAAPPPKRFVLFYSHQATLPWMWVPKSGGKTDFQLGVLLAPLESHKKDLVLLSGIDFAALDLPGGRKGEDGHGSGQACSLTANVQLNDPAQGTAASNQSRGTGASFDYWLARELEKLNGGKSPTPFGEQRFRIFERPPSNVNWGRPFQDANNTWQYADQSPNKTFTNLFGGTMASTGVDTKDVNRHKSALNFANEEFKQVGNNLGSFERQRLERHSQLIRDLEGSLSARASASCKANPMMPPVAYTADGTRWAHTLKHYPLLMQAAFACDLTRVISLQVEEPVPASYGGLDPGKLGGIDNLHDLVHAINVDSKENQNAERLKTVKSYYNEVTKTFKAVLDTLAANIEPDGSRMLDNTIVLWCGELAQPGHSTSNCKWLLAGGKNAGIKTGQYMNWGNDSVIWSASPNRPSNGDVFTSIAQAMGVQGKKFGNANSTKGPISDILA